MTRMRYDHVVCAVAKDEDYYLAEWAQHHLDIGFQHLFVYDNKSANYVEDLFRGTALQDKVTCIRWPTYPPESSQIAAYRHFADTYGKDVEWAAIIDIDEFINLKQDSNIKLFTDRFPGASGVGINWRIFGSSGHKKYEDRPVKERFRLASNLEFDANRLRKSIYRMSKVEELDIHTARFVDGAAVYSTDGSGIDADVVIDIKESNFQIAQINHYFVKSFEEWVKKIARGYSDATVRSLEMFDLFDQNEIMDDTILRHSRVNG